ncbi:hypothetical protein LPJ61_006973, partial [Coemansia biformis]
AGTMADAQTEAPRPAKRKSLAEMRLARRERQRIAQEGAVGTQEDAHQYLQAWDQHREQWKFNKAKQLWLVRHLYVEAKVPPATFDIAARYLSSTKGMLRESLLRDARLIANPAEAATEEQQALRTKALGLMPSHVSKGDARAARKARQDAKRTSTSAEAAEDDTPDNEPQAAETGVEAGAEASVTDGPGSEPSSNIRDRAHRIIELLTQVAPAEAESPPPAGKSKHGSTKSKRTRSESHSDHAADSETGGDPPAKKSRKDKKDKSEKKD